MALAWHRDLRTIPNLLTLSRVVLILVAAGLYVGVSRGAGLVVAVIGGLTDYADGMVARRTGQVTRLGEILDQWSDLCFESLGLLLAISEGVYPPLVALLYLLREFWVLSIRRYMAGRGLNIPSSRLGKLKSNFIMWSFLPTFLVVGDFVPNASAPWLAWVGHGGLAVGLLLSYASAWGYTRAFARGYEGA
jgi:CDP-diacylglycerol--glycerol-3-phosphate 3-phosphatidyltransferase